MQFNCRSVIHRGARLRTSIHDRASRTIVAPRFAFLRLRCPTSRLVARSRAVRDGALAGVNRRGGDSDRDPTDSPWIDVRWLDVRWLVAFRHEGIPKEIANDECDDDEGAPRKPQPQSQPSGDPSGHDVDDENDRTAADHVAAEEHSVGILRLERSARRTIFVAAVHRSPQSARCGDWGRGKATKAVPARQSRQGYAWNTEPGPREHRQPPCSLSTLGFQSSAK